MAFWFWVVVLSILALGLYELYSWYKQKNNPSLDETTSEEESATKLQAELARAKMKIAFLESRLVETEERLEASESQREKDAAALFQQEERYRQQLVQTEKAYQRQMVNLSERLGASGNGSSASRGSATVEYPVRMAAEVAAWKASLGDQSLMETAVSDGVAPLAQEISENIEAPDSDLDAAFEETAGSIYEEPPLTETPEEIETLEGEAAPEIETSPEPALLEAVVLSDILLEPEEDVLDQIVVMDEVQAKPEAVSHQSSEETFSGNVPSIDKAAPTEGQVRDDASDEVSTEVQTQINDAVYDEPSDEVSSEVEPPMNDEIQNDVGPSTEVETSIHDEGSGIDEALSVEQPQGDYQEASRESIMEKDASGENEEALVEEIPPLENHWSDDLMSIAMQRVMARQLGSEMDADYLDDEEFMREMGIEKEVVEEESSAESGNWITDPLKEMANYINGSEPSMQGEQKAETSAAGNPEGRKQEITGQMWEEVIFSSMKPAAKKNAGDPSPTLNPENETEVQTVAMEKESDTRTEEEAIAAAVSSILSRAPDPIEWQPDEEALLEDDNTGEKETADTGAGEAVIPETMNEVEPSKEAEDTAELYSEQIQSPEEQTPEEPSFVWQREPITWQAEYFNNTTLADEPVLVRQDADIDFEWREDAPGKGLDPRSFSVRWSGNLPLEPGHYRFMACAPDGLRLWLNDRLVISAWYDQSEQSYQRDFAWPGGTIDVRVEHYENGGSAKALMTWKRVA
jgi:hypothetical protein